MDTTIFYIIFGLMLIFGLIGQYFLNPYRKANDMSIEEISREEIEHILSWTIETLSEEYGVEPPKYKVGKVNNPEYGKGLPQEKGKVDGAVFIGHLNLIVLNEKYPTFGVPAGKLFGTICHEFQHYMDKLSMGSSDEWAKTYTENVDFYEMKAIQFGKTKSKELLKLYVNQQIN